MKISFPVMVGGVSLCGMFFFASSATATVYTIEDNWVNWPGYTTPLMDDENGTPKVNHMDVTVTDGQLKSVSIVLEEGQTTWQAYDSLFINTDWNQNDAGSWEQWDYFVHRGGTSNTTNTYGTVAADGFYSVNDVFEYTTVINANRVGNPNGIDADSLSNKQGFTVSPYGSVLTYDFTGMNLDVSGGFFIAYTPWCDNDIIGGGAPVPEPATMFLFGAGLAGLVGYRHRKGMRKA